MLFSCYFLNIQKVLIVILLTKSRPFPIRGGKKNFLSYRDTVTVGVTKDIRISRRAGFSESKRRKCFISLIMTLKQSRNISTITVFSCIYKKYQVPSWPFSVKFFQFIFLNCWLAMVSCRRVDFPNSSYVFNQVKYPLW